MCGRKTNWREHDKPLAARLSCWISLNHQSWRSGAWLPQSLSVTWQLRSTIHTASLFHELPHSSFSFIQYILVDQPEDSNLVSFFFLFFLLGVELVGYKPNRRQAGVMGWEVGGFETLQLQLSLIFSRLSFSCSPSLLPIYSPFPSIS